MQFKVLAALALGATSTLAAATGSPSSSGSLQCCDSTGEATDPAIATLLKSLGVDAQDVTALVGVTCSPITVVGVSGTSCSQQTVSCTNTSFKGIIALGCTPVNANL